MNMPNSITVTDITGTTPYEVYLCLSGGSPCYYINYIESSELPFVFTVPSPIQNLGGYCLRIIDNDGCIISNCFTIS
jgi:hypothetical protein